MSDETKYAVHTTLCDHRVLVVELDQIDMAASAYVKTILKALHGEKIYDQALNKSFHITHVSLKFYEGAAAKEDIESDDFECYHLRLEADEKVGAE